MLASTIPGIGTIPKPSSASANIVGSPYAFPFRLPCMNPSLGLFESFPCGIPASKIQFLAVSEEFLMSTPEDNLIVH